MTTNEGVKIHLVVWYKTPSLNVTKRQHWTEQFKEKQRAWSALLSALYCAASDPSTQITQPQASKICSTGYAKLGSSLGTLRRTSPSWLTKSELMRLIEKGQKSK